MMSQHFATKDMIAIVTSNKQDECETFESLAFTLILHMLPLRNNQTAYNFDAGDPLPTFVISLYKSLSGQSVLVRQECRWAVRWCMTYEVKKSA